MNRQDELGITTRLRIREAQLRSMCLSSITSNNENLDNIILKHNLAYRVVAEAKKLGFSFQKSSSYEARLDIKGTSLSSILEKKEANNYRNSNNMNIFVLEQLIAKNVNILLTWQQIKIIRGCKGRGRKPNWYKDLEMKVLEDSSSRILKAEY